MPIQINVKEDHVQPLVDFYGSKLQDVRDRKRKLEVEEKEYEEMIGQLLKKQNTVTFSLKTTETSVSINGYNSQWPLHEKIRFVLRKQNKALSTREILDHLYALDPALNADKEKTDKNISTVLSIKKDSLWSRSTEDKVNKFKLI